MTIYMQSAVRPVETIQLSAKDPAPTELAIADGVFPAVARIDATKATGTVSSTAVVFRDDGHLLTTADAVEGADTLNVQLYDGSVLPAVVVGVDRSTDVAVVKIEREQLQTAALGIDTALQLGEPTIAIECTDFRTAPVGNVDKPERGKSAKRFPHDGAANAKLVGEIAFAREIVADPKAGVANMRLYGLDRLRDERLSLI